tara:strand:- start:494 stop:892 length:399 start_codon:yes stop_codon:yes gene_type:complete
LTDKNLLTRKKLRNFGLLIGLAFPIIIGWIMPTFSGHSFRSWTILISLPFLITGILKPFMLKVPYELWMRVGDLLGFFNARIIFGLVFFIILLPISCVMKILGYDPLKVKLVKKKSYRENKLNYKIDLNKIF